MKAKQFRRLSAVSAAAVFLLSACTPSQNSSEDVSLTWGTWSGYDAFLHLAEKECPDIKLDFSAYAGADRSGYSWVQMRNDDIPDIFITSQVLDPDLAKERLADLSDYDFVDGIASGVVEQSSIDGGVYLLPVGSTVHGIYFNKTLMEEHHWEVPTDFAELESLCAQIEKEGITPGLVGTELNDSPFSAVFNVAKTGWFSTPEGTEWEQQFLSGDAAAAGMWEPTMDYIQKYIDIGMFSADPDDRGNKELIQEEMGSRQAVFFTSMLDVSMTELANGDELGIMPYISEDGSKNAYIYSPASYIGISSRLTEPGNEKKLDAAVRLLSLLYSQEGQDSFMSDHVPCGLSVLNDTEIPEDGLLFDAHQALTQGRVFPLTYTHWENVLYDMGKFYKKWFRGEDGMDGKACITWMDELQSAYLSTAVTLDFCESTDDFTLEETGILAGKALGSAAKADAAMIPIASIYKKGDVLSAGISGKLYKGMINGEDILTISPGFDGEIATLTMTGAEAKELAEKGFDLAGDKEPYPYLLVTKGDKELEDDQTYQVAFLMRSYTHEVGELYHAQVESASFRTILREWLKEQQTVSPDGNPWK